MGGRTMDQPPYKDALLRKRTEILGTGGIKPLQASMENNTYQYIVNREEAQLSWVAVAIAELGGAPAADVAAPDRSGKGKPADVARAIMEEDGRDAQAFVDRWRPRIDVMVNARHANMIRVILGETLEQKRFFEQALAGRKDLLGTRSPAAGELVGRVLSERWIE